MRCVNQGWSLDFSGLLNLHCVVSHLPLGLHSSLSKWLPTYSRVPQGILARHHHSHDLLKIQMFLWASCLKPLTGSPFLQLQFPISDLWLNTLLNLVLTYCQGLTPGTLSHLLISQGATMLFHIFFSLAVLLVWNTFCIFCKFYFKIQLKWFFFCEVISDGVPSGDESTSFYRIVFHVD